jgi:hypothetical protein
MHISGSNGLGWSFVSWFITLSLFPLRLFCYGFLVFLLYSTLIYLICVEFGTVGFIDFVKNLSMLLFSTLGVGIAWFYLIF